MPLLESMKPTSASLEINWWPIWIHFWYISLAFSMTTLLRGVPLCRPCVNQRCMALSNWSSSALLTMQRFLKLLLSLTSAANWVILLLDSCISVTVDFSMLYSEAIAVLEIPLSSFSRTSIFCSMNSDSLSLTHVTLIFCLHLGSPQLPRARYAWLHHVIEFCLSAPRACFSVDRSVRLSAVRIFQVLL